MSENRKKAEDVYAYTKILKFRNKRYGMSIRDFFIFIFAILVMGSLDLYQNEFITDNYIPMIFITSLSYLIFLLFAFFDFSTGIGIFKEKPVITSAFIIGISLIIGLGVALFADRVFIASANSELQAVVLLLNLIFSSAIISYFVMTSTPNRQGREEMIKNLNEINEEISKLSIVELGVNESLNRAIKWLQFQQNSERIWGEEEPLYETSEILRVFFDLGKDLGYSWKDVNKGEEDIHRLEQTYYLILETLERAVIKPDASILSALLTVGQVNPDNLNFEFDKSEDADKLLYKKSMQSLFDEFTDELNAQSEWDFINELEKLEGGFANRSKLPSIFYFSRIFQFINNKKVYYKCAEIFSETFVILLNRSDTRFNRIESKEVSSLILGFMYNSLLSLLKPVKIIGEEIIEHKIETKNEINEQELGISLPGFDDFDLSNDEGDMNLPGFDDFDFSGDDDIELNLDNDIPEEKMNINVSMSMVRSLIRKKQEIDGSWEGRIDSTAECLTAVMDRESSESDFIKFAVHYLLALQEKNGSWQNDPHLTSQVMRALYKVSGSLGGLQ